MDILVEIKDLTKSYDGRAVLTKFSLTIKKGEKAAIMGSSGKGKTTLLRLIAGLEKPDGGSITLSGTVAYMFQEPRLLPWKSAIDNVRAVLKKEHLGLADKYLTAVGLKDDALKYPRELSGGMAQRVAFARFLAFAKATEADILLLDEPFSALDKETCQDMISLLMAECSEKTIIAVTHDQSQAEMLGGSTINV